MVDFYCIINGESRYYYKYRMQLSCDFNVEISSKCQQHIILFYTCTNYLKPKYNGQKNYFRNG